MYNVKGTTSSYTTVKGILNILTSHKPHNKTQATRVTLKTSKAILTKPCLPHEFCQDENTISLIHYLTTEETRTKRTKGLKKP